MKLKEFTDILDNKGYSYKFEEVSSNQKMMFVYHYETIYLPTLESFPVADFELIIIFRNHGGVNLQSLKKIPEKTKVEFDNSGHLHLDSLESLQENISLINGGFIHFNSIKNVDNIVKCPRILDVERTIYFNNIRNVSKQVGDVWQSYKKTTFYLDFRK